MTLEQEALVHSLVQVQEAMYVKSFMTDKVGFENMQYYFDRLIDSVRMSIGQQQIKEFLDQGKN